jgi:isocitrate/isopropylmalate dehydrogenase
MTSPDAKRDRSMALIGVLPGEGCGPALTSHALELLAAAAPGAQLEIETGGAIGETARRSTGSPLPDEVARFCDSIFERGGSILAGAGGDRFVYEARRRFGLYAKKNPVHSFPELAESGRWRPSPDPVDLLVVRENLGGLYHSHRSDSESGPELTTLAFPTDHADVADLTQLAARLAAERRGRLTVVTKESGIPDLHRVWADAARRAAGRFGVDLDFLDVDVAAYQLLRAPSSFDVIATSNCFGDILSDVGGHLMGSRGNTYGASYSRDGKAIYQTNHGSAADIAGADRVNPAGQILSLALLVREQLGWDDVAAVMTGSVRATWRSGLVTADLDGPGLTTVGTSEWMRACLGNVRQLACDPA